MHANVVIGDAADARFVLGDLKQERYRKGFLYDTLRTVVPRGLTNTEGADWRHSRHFITPVFYATNLDSMVGLMYAHIDRHLSAWATEHPIDTSLEIHRKIASLTLQIIFDAAMGVRRS